MLPPPMPNGCRSERRRVLLLAAGLVWVAGNSGNSAALAACGASAAASAVGASALTHGQWPLFPWRPSSSVVPRGSSRCAGAGIDASSSAATPMVDRGLSRRSWAAAAAFGWLDARPAAAEGTQVTDNGGKVAVYFGHGNFWRAQHEVTLWSLRVSKAGQYPEGSFSPALAGYAGARGTDDDGRICYSTMNGLPYDKMGYSEVVALDVPSVAMEDMARRFFDDVAAGPRGPGPKDGISSSGVVSGGNAYRDLIGLPGGTSSADFPAIERANAGRLKLVPGQGGDPDTLNQGVVYIYDTAQFPFNRAEMYHQYHDDVSKPFSAGYKGLKKKFQQAGVIGPTGCAE